MLISLPIPGIQLFQNLTLKIQGRGHGWGHSWKSQHESNIQLTHIPFVPSQLGIPFLSYDFFKIWPWKSRGQGHGWGHSSNHNVGLTSYRLTSLSFHVNQPSQRYSVFKIWPWKSRVKVKWPWCCTTTGLDKWYKSIQWFKRYGFRKVWPKCSLIRQVFGPWASPYGSNGQISMTLHDYRSRQVYKTLNGVNPSSGFRDMHSAKSGPNLIQIWQVFSPWATPYGTNCQMTMTLHN